DIPFQTYRDFAENKGMFAPGNKNIPIYDKNGNIKNILTIPVPDFSSISTLGIATLVDAQHIASVKHNGGYTNVSFGGGDNLYTIVNRNNNPSVDFHAPRLNKLVTEVAPMEVAKIDVGNKFDEKRYTQFIRIGSGSQIITESNKTIANPYAVLTGGTVGDITYKNWWGGVYMSPTGNLGDHMGPLPNHPQPGDSGSPLFAYDNVDKKWVLFGVFYGYNDYNSFYTPIQLEQLNSIASTESDGIIVSQSNDVFHWSFDKKNGLGKIQQGNHTYEMHGRLSDNLDNGKNITFTGNSGHILLDNDIDQGAGSLTFLTDYTVGTSNNSTWIGGGLDIHKNATVTWKVNGQKNDNLHKIGEGTLIVNASGINEGGLKVGNGVTVLNQQPDAYGRVQAFSSVNIASGRPTVVLSNDKQINPDNITWGYRGGVLDVNGNNLTFHVLNAADHGAIISNSSDKTAEITLDLPSKNHIYHGKFIGNLDIVNKTQDNNSNTLIMDGSANITGSFTTENGRLLLQGYPVIHAFSSQSIVDKTNSLGDYSTLNKPTSSSQNDWENRHYLFNELNLNNSDLSVSRNAHLQANINATGSNITLGDNRVYIDENDGNGIDFKITEGKSDAVKKEDESTFVGRISISQNSSLSIKNNFNGSITSSDSNIKIDSRNVILNDVMLENSLLNLKNNSRVQLTGDLKSNEKIDIDDSTLVLNADRKTEQMYNSKLGWILNGDKSILTVLPLSHLYGDIISSGNTTLTFGDLNYSKQTLGGQLSGNQVFYSGKMMAPSSRVDMYATKWSLSGDSEVDSLIISNTSVGYHANKTTSSPWSLAGVTPSQAIMTDLKMNSLSATNSSFTFRTNGKESDKLIVTGKAQGKSNTLYVNFLKLPSSQEKLNLPLIEAPLSTKLDIFKPGPSKRGFSEIMPIIRTVNSEQKKKWILTGYEEKENKKITKQATDFMKNGVDRFLIESNNLNKRMGELRNLNYDTGVWARIVNGKGASENGYNDTFNHVQIGYDKKSEKQDFDVFTGLTATYTHSNGSSDFYNGTANTYGLGYYSSIIYDCGLYADFISKVLYSEQDYNLHLLGFGNKKSKNYSFLTSFEFGYRHSISDNSFIEPKAEIISGYISKNDYAWNNNGINLAMMTDSNVPVIGKLGVSTGNIFSLDTSNITTHAGVYYEFDITKTPDITLRDDVGTYNIKGKKDARMVYSVGINGNINKNTRIGVDIERSSFGDYNINHLV
ncbi:autotransporter outer membrane beta-barrel domain-containing protein, partial [Escherichia coli]|nr:autotransporter outer membrane beta-barrel domain-containing protein [Escherichia coli]